VHSADADNHLSKGSARLIVVKGLEHIGKCEDLVDDRPQPMFGDGPVHSDEMGATTGGDDPQRRDRVKQNVDVDGRGVIKPANEPDLSFDGGRLDRFLERPTADPRRPDRHRARRSVGALPNGIRVLSCS
jgi:hypothetical protein